MLKSEAYQVNSLIKIHQKTSHGRIGESQLRGLL